VASKQQRNKTAPKRPRRLRPGNLFKRIARARPEATDAVPAAAAPAFPEAVIDPSAGTVRVEITFGFAQHGTYTLQLFDPPGTRLLASVEGVSTDQIPDTFDLQPAPTALAQHLVQWSGAVDAFTEAPGQKYSVTVRVLQNGVVVPGGERIKEGPLDVTQAFLAAVRLVL
jgi:hypothetical protein